MLQLALGDAGGNPRHLAHTDPAPQSHDPGEHSRVGCCLANTSLLPVLEGSEHAAMTVDGFQHLRQRHVMPLGEQVTKRIGLSGIDRRGGDMEDAIDISMTVAKLEKIGIRVHCLALGGVDLTSSAGKMTMNVINAVAQFERDLLIERTQAGLDRAKAQGKTLGRPPAFSLDQQKTVREKIDNGEAISAIARQFSTSRQTIMRARNQP